jgi:arabinose-5-phosphate isomerase
MSFQTCKICSTVSDKDGFCFNPACSLNLENKINRYSNQISESSESFQSVVKNLVLLLKNFQKTIYIAGIGKSAHVVCKCVATWQSLGIQAQTVLIQDLFHGDLGVLKEGDMIIYVSNSGNTEELIVVAKYVQKHFSIFQIALTNNPSAILNQYVDKSFNICSFKIQEADILNLAPSVSCVLFMIILDLTGILIAELNGFTREQFKLHHPGGDLGKLI